MMMRCAIRIRLLLFWVTAGTVLPRGRYVNLTLAILFALLVAGLALNFGSRIRVSIRREFRSLVAVAGSQVATLGVALYVATLAVTRVLTWTATQKVLALLLAGTAAGITLSPGIDLGWIFGSWSELEAGVGTLKLPHIP